MLLFSENGSAVRCWEDSLDWAGGGAAIAGDGLWMALILFLGI